MDVHSFSSAIRPNIVTNDRWKANNLPKRILDNELDNLMSILMRVSQTLFDLNAFSRFSLDPDCQREDWKYIVHRDRMFGTQLTAMRRLLTDKM